MNFDTFFLLLVIFNIAVLSVAMYFVWTHLSARGARPLFLFLFGLMGFTAMYLCSLLVRRESSKESMMIVAYGFILLLPIFWTQLVYEFSGRGQTNAWHFNLPFGIINSIIFLLFLIDIPGVPQLLYFHSCNLNDPIFLCKVIYSNIFYVVMGFLLFEFFGGLGWLLYSFFAEKHNEERSRYLFLSIAVGFGILSIWLPIVLPSARLNVFDPLPVMLIITTGLLLLATFNKRLLAIRIGGIESISLMDDLLLMVDNDHYIQDINISILSIFGMEVQDVVSTQLEVAFADHPEIINLFNENVGHVDILELMVDDKVHYFEPTLSVIMDTETGLSSGLQLRMKDVSDRHVDESTSEGPVGILRDPLTNQYTRESFYQFGGKLLSHTRRREQPATVIMIDIDDFDSVNQRYSHLVGDQALIQLMEIINRMIRSTDLMARFQSDEFVLLLPDADEYAAYQICSRIKDTVATHRFSSQAQEFQMTVSIGYTTIEPNDAYDLEQVVRFAVQALEQSHSLGRNRLTFLPAAIEEI